jgi:AbrB family looped-hinge helix DNA binding protein
MSSTGKITSKGQITIPRDMRKILGTDIIEFEAAGETVILKPVRSVGGSLGKYARRPAPFNEVRNAAWESVVRDRKKK